MITDTRRTHLRRQEFLQAAAERLQQEWREGHHIKSCPVFFNITNFHLYNAAHGFRQGDLCLQHIENILQEVFPCQPVLHLGSDNFSVLAVSMYSRASTRPASACWPSSGTPTSR